MVDLSIVVPTIRPQRLETFVQSVEQSTKRSFEIIFCGPYGLPRSLEPRKNIKVVRDFGSPVRARQIGLHLCEGRYVTCTSDDCRYLPGSIDAYLDRLIEGTKENYKHVVVGPYIEGQDGRQKTIQSEAYWKLNNAYPRSQYINDSWWIFNTSFLTSEFLVNELGGFDCRFQSLACADADLAVRAYRSGATVEFVPTIIQDIDWAPGIDGYGDHRPIWWAQTYSDVNLYQDLHCKAEHTGVLSLQLDNWKSAPAIWAPRFDEKTVQEISVLNG